MQMHHNPLLPPPPLPLMPLPQRRRRQQCPTRQRCCEKQRRSSPCPRLPCASPTSVVAASTAGWAVVVAAARVIRVAVASPRALNRRPTTTTTTTISPISSSPTHLHPSHPGASPPTSAPLRLCSSPWQRGAPRPPSVTQPSPRSPVPCVPPYRRWATHRPRSGASRRCSQPGGRCCHGQALAVRSGTVTHCRSLRSDCCT